MGCTNSSELAKEERQFAASCFKDDAVTKSLTSFNYNEVEVDISHFSRGNDALGLGGFGMVRLVKKLSGPDRGTEYAMKSMSKSAILKRSSGPAAVNTELSCLMLLVDCKYVCQLHYAFQSTSHLFMVLELAKGGDLRHCLRATPKSRFSEEAARHIVCQVFVALEHCHKVHILHRDIKPENILVTDTGVVKLSDFGVAKILTRIEDCRSTSGTHGYMAPEVYMNAHVHGTASEWFSVGITLHELLTGRRPFEANRLQAFRHRTQFPEADADYHPALLFDSADPGPHVFGRAPQTQYTGSRVSSGSGTDALWPDFLNQCDFLSQGCKDFVRALLIPDPRYRLGGANSAPCGLPAVRQHPWMRGCNWNAPERVLSPQKTAPPHPLWMSEFLVVDAAAPYHSPHQRQVPRVQQPAAATLKQPAAKASPFHVFSSSTHRQPPPAAAVEVVGAAPVVPPVPAPGPGAGAAVPNDLVSKEEMRRALVQHLQAPAISESQQVMFKNYEYRNAFMAEVAEGGGGSSSWSDSSDNESPTSQHGLPTKGEAKQWYGRGGPGDGEKGVETGAAKCRRRRQHRHHHQQGAVPSLRCGGAGQLALKDGFTRGEDSPVWEETSVVFSPRDARRNTRKKSCI